MSNTLSILVQHLANIRPHLPNTLPIPRFVQYLSSFRLLYSVSSSLYSKLTIVFQSSSYRLPIVVQSSSIRRCWVCVILLPPMREQQIPYALNCSMLRWIRKPLPLMWALTVPSGNFLMVTWVTELRCPTSSLLFSATIAWSL